MIPSEAYKDIERAQERLEVTRAQARARLGVDHDEVYIYTSPSPPAAIKNFSENITSTTDDNNI